MMFFNKRADKYITSISNLFYDKIKKEYLYETSQKKINFLAQDIYEAIQKLLEKNIFEHQVVGIINKDCFEIHKKSNGTFGNSTCLSVIVPPDKKNTTK